MSIAIYHFSMLSIFIFIFIFILLKHLQTLKSGLYLLYSQSMQRFGVIEFPFYAMGWFIMGARHQLMSVLSISMEVRILNSRSFVCSPLDWCSNSIFFSINSHCLQTRVFIEYFFICQHLIWIPSITAHINQTNQIFSLDIVDEKLPNRFQ